MIKNILLPYFINRVDLVILLSVKSTKPVDPNSTFCTSLPVPSLPTSQDLESA